MKSLQDGIELLIRSKEIRALNKKWNLADQLYRSESRFRKKGKTSSDKQG
jgi:hypothetical protein